ncbi:helix-turn-helix domain-containing protein [uncultured Tyzzerella sp.]|uniref:DUF6115 domain-containing protein n=1 Tax=uncultured Tyzzerella sp. TaxID=2321398 RepID=UPI00294385FD|nr:helix-turn-helix domain-containing protein [uncultured Tyzzerella sp.]
MEIFNWIFIFVMIIGFIMIIVSIININKYNNATPVSSIDGYIKEMKEAIDQADLAIDDLNLMSEEVFKRFDEKQKQLLFIYDAIEKKKNMSSGGKFDIKIDENISKDINKEDINKKNHMSLHPMADEVKKLHKNGMSVSDIAKKLNIGKGEVELIINLGKGNL